MIVKRIILVVACCLIGAMLLLPLPVAADEAKPTITKVYFDKDGMPYNGSVQYTVKCYGYQTERGMFPYRTPKPGETQTREMVYSYSATCPGYGCTIYEPYYHVDRKFIDRCDLEGTADGVSFRIDNFSTQPYTRCNSLVRHISMNWNSTRMFYYPTPEYESCRKVRENYQNRWGQLRLYYSESGIPINISTVIELSGKNLLYETSLFERTYVNRSDIQMDSDRYIAYLENCNTASDPFCPGWIVDGKPLKQYPEYRPFMNNATHLAEHPCDTFLIAADPTTIVPENEMPDMQCMYTGACNVPDTGYLPGSFDIRQRCEREHCFFAQDYCKSRFTIPPLPEKSHADVSLTGTPHAEPSPFPSVRNQNDTIISSPAVRSSGQVLPSKPIVADSVIPRSPVESLYCSIVELLGGKCE